MKAIVAVVIFVLMFALIILDKIPRHWITLGCAAATLLIVFGICMKSPAAITETLNIRSIFTGGFWISAGESSSSGINWETIIFVAGMMVMVEGMAKAGFFRWLCLTIAKAVKYKVLPILVTFMVMSAVLAMFIDSITVILFLAAVTVELSQLLKFDPVPMVLAEIFCANLGGWGERNVSIQLSGLLDGIKVLVGNDADVAALGEIWMGCAKGCRSAVMVTLGTGVGGGVIVNGRIIEGAHGAGGEIGHITVNPHETAVCGCGKHGCLEQYSSATGVVRCMKKLLDENPDTPCTLRGTDFAAKDVFDAARAGDALAAREVDEMTDTLGMALASIASTTDPEMFMVGGGVARAGDVLFNPLREHFKTYAFSSCRETPIVAATLGNDAGIYGAVRLIVGE